MVGIFNSFGTGHIEEYHRQIMPSQQEITSFDNKWSLSVNPTGTNVLSIMSVQFSYTINGIDYNFWGTGN